MIEYEDSSTIAQLSPPDMRLPIQYAITYPRRLPSPTASLDFINYSSLTFETPDLNTFPCLDLAIKTAKVPGTACCILNAANEAAVDLFLHGKLSFYGIHEAIENAMQNIRVIETPTLDDILQTDKAAKEFVYNNCQKNNM
jgi:1-deoxy-D-xylulose-5-phosphate reductoisomerase